MLNEAGNSNQYFAIFLIVYSWLRWPLRELVGVIVNHAH